MGKHTPEPWIIFVDRSSGESRFDVLPAGRDGEIACDIANEADAQLIMAAPALLRACRAALNMVDGDGAPPNWNTLRAAVSLATDNSAISGG